jgi:hypothetical protein
MSRIYWERRPGLAKDCEVCCGTCVNSVLGKGKNFCNRDGCIKDARVEKLPGGMVRVTSTCSGRSEVYSASMIKGESA